MWLPLEVASHASVIELFYLDAALAFDPNYLSYDLTNSGTFLTTALQIQYFNLVGQGVPCTAGNCTYANVINQVHGSH